jgi:hypothetical protein
MKYARLVPGIGFSPLNSFLYYSQRIVTFPRLRSLCVRLITIRLRSRGRHNEKLESEQQPLANLLGSNGYVPLGNLLSACQCRDVHDYLRDKELTDRHNSAQKFPLTSVPRDVQLADYHLRDVVNCPHILDLANSPLLLGLAEQYIGCSPTISALGLRWSFPKQSGESSLQAFHRDADDWRFFKVMVYLTDVGPDDGPHMYAIGTHLEKTTARLQFYSEGSVYGRRGHEGVVTAMGGRGTAFAVDTVGIHKGSAPTRHARLLLQIQYSLLPNYSYEYEPEINESARSFDRYINRLIVKSTPKS